MKITRIDLWHVAYPLSAPFEPSWIPGMRQTENRFDLIRLTTASGLEGWSAAPAMGREREGFGALLGPYFLGERADDLASVRQRIREMGYLGHRCGWIEPACWDIVGKARQKPVWKLLGGRPGKVRLYASTGELKGPTERIDEVQARLAEGFTAAKLRVHDDDPSKDVAQLRETRKAVGDDVVLGVDANQAWRVAVVADAPRWDLDRAMGFCQQAADLGFAWVEEPLPMDDYEGLSTLTAASTVPIAGGELNSQGLPEFGTMIGLGCYDWYQPDAVFTGGIAETWAIIQQVHAAGARYTPHTWTNGIGFAINLQLFAAAPNRDDGLLEYPLSPPGWIPEGRDGLLRQPWVHERGELAIPEAPGLGFEIDASALRRYGTHFFTATKLRVALRALRDRGLQEARHLGAIRDERIGRRHQALNQLIASGGDPTMDALGDLAEEAPADD